MTIALGNASSLADHAVCIAAGMRDGMRATQYYVRDVSQADNAGSGSTATPLSRAVGRIARLIDSALSKLADLSVRLFVPQWRNMPSPFAPHMAEEVVKAIRENRLVLTSVFTAYFFRASRHILNRCTDGPALILEHRVDAARRALADRPLMQGATEDLLGHVLLALVDARAIARTAPAHPQYRFLNGTDPNLAVMATACLALLLAEDGKPIESIDEDEFFAIVGALLAPRLPVMERALAARDIAGLSKELAAVRELY
jgi:hypothetical protein